MAEELGTAVLRIDVDDGPARKKLDDLRTEVARTSRSAAGTRTAAGGSRGGSNAGPDPALRAERALTRLTGQQTRLTALEIRGFNVARQRSLLDRAQQALSTNDFKTTSLLTQRLETALKIDEGRLRVAKLRADAEKKIAAAASSTTSGSVNRNPSASSSTREAILERIAQQRSLQTAGGGGLTRFLRDASAKEEAAKRSSAQESKRLTDFENRLTKARTASAAATQRNFEAERKQARASTQGRIASGLIGGGFPLLFGQGGGAAAGGLLGGLIGGGPFGFGASIIGTLLGSQIDLLNQRFGELSNALEDPIANFDVFIQKATLASKAQESLVLALQETGQAAAAAELIRKEAAQTIDPVSAQGAVIAQDDFNRVLSDTQDILGSIVSGPATGFLEFLTTVLRIVAGTPQERKVDPITNAVEGAEKASKKLGTNIGGILAGLGLAAGGVATTFATGGAGAGFGVPLIASGLSIAGIGAAGAGAAAGDTRVATSEAVIAAELAVTAAKERQLALEREILQARASGKKGLDEQVSLRARFNALQVEELQGLSRIQQELARKEDGFNDLEDQATAIRQEKELRAAIELRRQALLAAASAAQTASVKELKDAKQLVGKYGAEREIASTQLEIKSAIDSAYQAQLQLNKARKEGAGTAEIEAAEKIVNTLINKRILTELEGTEKIRKIRKDITSEIQLQTEQFDIQSQAIERQIATTQRLSNIPIVGGVSIQRDAAEAASGIQDRIEQALDRQRSVAALLRDAQRRGLGNAEGARPEIQRLSNDLVNAAQETKLRLAEGAKFLDEAGIRLRENLRNAVLSFTSIRSDPQGLNRFLNPQQQNQRALFDFKLLQPAFREAQGRFTQLTGQRAPEFSGPTADVNAAMRDLIQATNREFDARNTLVQTQQALNKTNADLVSVNTKLIQVTQTLADKDWTINLTQNASGQWQASGDAKSQAELRAASTL